ncbi:MAG: hypothetical protein K6G36_01195 [Candidatus Saccharibacteria bacterium]|nr:hypothetical protein [Candidatus Saccharibacteria bacterium]
MKKIHRRVFGLLGLAIVVALTVFAAIMPTPNASAADGTILRVRVIGDVPNVTITDGPTSVVPSAPTPIVTTPDQSFTYINEKVDHVVVTLHYEDPDGHTSDYTLDDYYINYVADGKTIDLNLDNYGYGTYTVTVSGDGQYGYDEDTISFIYVPVRIDAEQPAIDEDPVADYFYDASKTDHAVLNVYTDDGTLISTLANIPVTIGNFTSTLPFEANGMEEGWYKVEIVTYDDHNDVIATAIDRFYYDLSGGVPTPTEVDIEAEQPAIDEDPIATYDYDASITDHAILNVYDDDGNLITVLSNIPVTIGEYTTTLPFGENNMEEGWYRVEIITYDDQGNVLGTDIDRFFYDLSGGEPAPTKVEIDAEQPAIDEDPVATYEYNASITDHAILNVYDDDGNLITVLSNIPVTIGEFTTTLPFGENGMEKGYYRVEIITYDENGNELGRDIDRFYYNLSKVTPEPKPDDEDVPDVPNTGLFTNLNISRADYVTTGLIVFFASAVFALVYIARKGSKRR